MNCPYCNAEMEPGTIYNKIQVKWQDNTKSLFPKTVNLSKAGILGGKATAWLCENCQKVIVDYSEIPQD